MPLLIAIDPGMKGGAAIGDPTSVKPPALYATPGGDLESFAETIRNYVAMHTSEKSEAVVELVGGYVGLNQPGSRAFVFGTSYGAARGVLAALEVPTRLVPPQQWQKALSLGNSKGMSKTEWKNKLKAKAQQLFPSSKITLATADAALIWHAAAKNLI
jgi:hypothetical protein